MQEDKVAKLRSRCLQSMTVMLVGALVAIASSHLMHGVHDDLRRGFLHALFVVGGVAAMYGLAFTVTDCIIYRRMR
ncbi:MAG: hypothetical protein ABIH41_04905 [Nanoarchaeota archaeon]